MKTLLVAASGVDTICVDTISECRRTYTIYIAYYTYMRWDLFYLHTISYDTSRFYVTKVVVCCLTVRHSHARARLYRKEFARKEKEQKLVDSKLFGKLANRHICNHRFTSSTIGSLKPIVCMCEYERIRKIWIYMTQSVSVWWSNRFDDN